VPALVAAAWGVLASVGTTGVEVAVGTLVGLAVAVPTTAATGRGVAVATACTLAAAAGVELAEVVAFAGAKGAVAVGAAGAAVLRALSHAARPHIIKVAKMINATIARR